jgi:hypothetical protein
MSILNDDSVFSMKCIQPFQSRPELGKWQSCMHNPNEFEMPENQTIDTES